MRYAIIADIHANYEAFQTVLEDTKAMNCTHYCCLGDVVGYNANPKECLDIVRQMGMPCVKGNHDEYCSAETDLEGFNPHAQEAINWTREQLTEDDRKWLRELRYIRL
ncbi:MAG TPA: metallophosphoesterase, partial [Verrucomicrobiae bacterium]|nr:metallophosphoesterase [Verrucomicrobiae bacterium]